MIVKGLCWIGVLVLAIMSGAIVPIVMLSPIVIPAALLGAWMDRQDNA